MYAAAASAIEIKVHGDDGDDGDVERCDDTESQSTGAVQSAIDSQGVVPGEKKDRQVLELTQTGILSNRRPTKNRVGQNDHISDSSTPAMAGASPKRNLLAMAKREAARRELYRRFYRGETICEQPEQDLAETGALQGDKPLAADQRKAERKQRREERRALKQQARDQGARTPKRRKVV